jgi:hypothetical protein
MIAFDASHATGALPPPLAGEGGGEGVAAGENPQEERTLTRRTGRCFASPGAPTSPASGRGEANFQLVMKHQG